MYTTMLEAYASAERRIHDLEAQLAAETSEKTTAAATLKSELEVHVEELQRQLEAETQARRELEEASIRLEANHTALKQVGSPPFPERTTPHSPLRLPGALYAHHVSTFFATPTSIYSNDPH
ncbi:unnamed protein product [Protopolystoma xenopodis]|uniref:Uncharacterized protein n=1 Tax=Protopolystoma xenopodis TaxID=117903 RepID=A0A448X3J1_9PLAT|nr:unnamed protein product [Protopolystoma xenopodis]